MTRRRGCIFLVMLAGVALLVFFEPTYCVRGWLRGEAFFDGRPTSYWSAELEKWEFEIHLNGDIDRISRRRTLFEFTFEGQWFRKKSVMDEEIFPGLRFFGNDEEIPVLDELTHNRCRRIRDFAHVTIAQNEIWRTKAE